MSTSNPDDDRLVELDDTAEGDGVETTADDPETKDAELHAETPLPLDDEELRGDGPPEDIAP